MKWFKLFCFLIVFASMSTSAHAEIHALIMTISQYQGGIPPLKGVAYDAENAKAIAHAMGVKDENIHILKDDQLTLAGMRSAFDDLATSLNPGDEVFIYYSGHGGRQYVMDPDERCAESLITDDTQGFIDAELSAKLKALSAKAQKVIVLLDACHSGGVTTRGINARFESKYWSRGEMDACSKPVNVVTRGLDFAARSAGTGAQNYVYIAAAKDDEVSLDEPGKGGVATQAWLKCMSGDARDLDGSGGLTAEEVRVCAQGKIDDMLKGVSGFTPHHITITGNPGMVMKLVDTPPAGPAKPAEQEKPEEATTPAAPPNPVEAAKPDEAVKPVEAAKPPPLAEQNKISPAAALLDIYNGRDDRRTVTLTPVKTSLTIGSDPIDFTLTSTHSGYVYLLMAGSDGNAFDMLFPNKLDGSNYIEAGQPMRLPRSNWEIVPQGPAGKDQLLVIVAESPRDFSSVGMKPSGPFSSVGASLASAKDIQLVTGVSANAGSDICLNHAKTRNLGVVANQCSNMYGAAMLTIDEVK